MFTPLLQGIERTDDEYQLDDVFMSRAAGKQSEAHVIEKDKMAAIAGMIKANVFLQ